MKDNFNKTFSWMKRTKMKTELIQVGNMIVLKSRYSSFQVLQRVAAALGFLKMASQLQRVKFVLL
jgi:hypothetical protein